jgi:hypothetical protein
MKLPWQVTRLTSLLLCYILAMMNKYEHSSSDFGHNVKYNRVHGCSYHSAAYLRRQPKALNTTTEASMLFGVWLINGGRVEKYFALKKSEELYCSEVKIRIVIWVEVWRPIFSLINVGLLVVVEK